jgi:leucyl-tRNA synthetase
MAVPAHDQRDWDFAKKYGIEITEVIKGENSDIANLLLKKKAL